MDFCKLENFGTFAGGKDKGVEFCRKIFELGPSPLLYKYHDASLSDMCFKYAYRYASKLNEGPHFLVLEMPYVLPLKLLTYIGKAALLFLSHLVCSSKDDVLCSTSLILFARFHRKAWHIKICSSHEVTPILIVHDK